MLPTLKWMKDGCPSAYTYPYDDMSATFVCNNEIDDINQTDYLIEFCPETQLPSASFAVAKYGSFIMSLLFGVVLFS